VVAVGPSPERQKGEEGLVRQALALAIAGSEFTEGVDGLCW
jgi:hypothetical protein